MTEVAATTKQNCKCRCPNKT